MSDRESKQMIIMRKDLQMTKGKMIAQGSHASLGVVLEMMSMKQISILKKDYSMTLNVKEGSPLDTWMRGGFKKVCVYVNSEKELIDIYNMAKKANLPAILITDGGLTMFKGVPTKTCVAIGPAFEDDIDKITGNLKLL